VIIVLSDPNLLGIEDEVIVEALPVRSSFSRGILAELKAINLQKSRE
jgi:hypothetical protein